MPYDPSLPAIEPSLPAAGDENQVMTHGLVDERPSSSIPIICVGPDAPESWRERLDDTGCRWIERTGFSAERDTHRLIPDPRGEIAAVVAGISGDGDPFALAQLATDLPAGVYHLVEETSPLTCETLSLGWALACYRFDRYRKLEPASAHLSLSPNCDRGAIRLMADAITQVRDLINTPGEDLTPTQLGEETAALAASYGARITQVSGDALLEHGFPAVHAVGRAAAHPPRLIDLVWGPEDAPAVTLVGKGVCFDSGGLDLKPASGMRLMKKDMGGAAHAIGLARLLMGSELPVRLRLIIPAVENAVSKASYRPGDVVSTRAGVSVEIENTDAEGRVILADALAAAGEDRPELIIDFATLTGAARVALGPDLPGLFCNRRAVAEGLREAGERVRDPIWELPLHAPYREFIESKVADVANAGSVPLAGAITAALFLERFVPTEVGWAHFDLMAWNLRSRPGRPEGGEALGLRAGFEYLRRRYSTPAQ